MVQSRKWMVLLYSGTDESLRWFFFMFEETAGGDSPGKKPTSPSAGFFMFDETAGGDSPGKKVPPQVFLCLMKLLEGLAGKETDESLRRFFYV